jgi:hypothetical protein
MLEHLLDLPDLLECQLGVRWSSHEGSVKRSHSVRGSTLPGSRMLPGSVGGKNLAPAVASQRVAQRLPVEPSTGGNARLATAPRARGLADRAGRVRLTVVVRRTGRSAGIVAADARIGLDRAHARADAGFILPARRLDPAADEVWWAGKGRHRRAEALAQLHAGGDQRSGVRELDSSADNDSARGWQRGTDKRIDRHRQIPFSRNVRQPAQMPVWRQWLFQLRCTWLDSTLVLSVRQWSVQLLGGYDRAATWFTIDPPAAVPWAARYTRPYRHPDR